MRQANILDQLSMLHRRHIRLAAGVGAAIGIMALLGGIALCMWIDVVMELAPALRIAATAVVLAGGIYGLTGPVMRARRQITRQQLAGELDRAGGHGGQILSGSDFAEAGDDVRPRGELSMALATISVARASDLASIVPLESAAPGTGARNWVFASVCAVAATVVVTLVAPRLVTMQWARIIDPFGDHPPYSRIELTVAPGNTSALFGQGVDISVAASQDIESAEMVWQTQSSAPQVLPMFRESTGRWRGTIAEARESGAYFIRTPSARSYRYKVDVVMVPQIRSVRFRIAAPEYTRKPIYDGPLPQDGIAGLPGTRVEVMATSNRPLAGGMMQVPAAVSPTSTQPSAKVMLLPSGPNSTEVRGQFTLTESGKLSIQLVDTDGHRSAEPFTAQVNLLKDQRPLVRLLQPEPLSLATPSAILAVQAEGEDDYGVTRVQIFRSLDGSRPRAADVQTSAPAATRVDGTEVLNLAAYRLEPGQTLEFFARAEDNDPAGAKGSETPVTVVKIISEQQMRELELARAGIETLENKYQQAERLMESLQQQLAAIDKQIGETGESSAQTSSELDKALGAFDKAEAQLDQLTADKLPLALDEQLRDAVSKLSDQVHQARSTLKQGNVNTPGSIASAVSRATSILKDARAEYEEKALRPLEDFAKIYALKEDEARFVELYNRQKDLALRFASLKNQTAVDDPSTMARLRDLEDQQREIREDLVALLPQIEAHAAALPEEPTFADLRASALDFVQKARASGAEGAMANAENAMSAFQGKESWSRADEAANILYSLLSHCNNMGDKACSCLKFAPGLCDAMDQTIDQLLSGLGMKSGRNGIGVNGYSERRNTAQNVGLYSSRPRTSKAQSGRDSSAGGMILKTSASQADGNAAAPRAGTAGESNGAPQVPVPAQYKRRVSDYYQRVADELSPVNPPSKRSEK